MSNSTLHLNVSTYLNPSAKRMTSAICSWSGDGDWSVFEVVGELLVSSITLACWVGGDEHASVWVQVNLQAGTNK